MTPCQLPGSEDQDDALWIRPRRRRRHRHAGPRRASRELRTLNPPHLSIVIPAFNEATRLGRTIERIREYAGQHRQLYELIVVNDGSTDGTAERVLSIAPDAEASLPESRSVSDALQIALIGHSQNRGKGFAVRRGILAASADPILMTDADLSAPIEEVENLLPWLDRGYDVIIGSRDLPDSVLDPPQPLARRVAAWTFRALRRRLLLPDIRDTQCGFKLFRRHAAREIFSRQIVDGWLFDCEVLGIADKLGFRTREVGIRWRNHPDSRVRPLSTAIGALPELLRMRARLRHMHSGD